MSYIPNPRAAMLVGVLLSLALLGPPVMAAGSEGYHRFTAVEEALRDAAATHPNLVELIAIGTSAGGRTLHVARVAGAGDSDPDTRPGIFVGANIAGFHNPGTEAALHLLDTLLTSDEVAALLASHTFYIAPALHPDAHDGFFATPRQRRSGNGQSLDHDRDGLVGEDGGDDLDGDGRITRLRILDPAGGWLPHPDDPRLMVKADAAKAWIGAYRMEDEGRDNDGDGTYNEDPNEGITPDRNFPHAFPFPAPEAGPWSSAAPETRAVLDFLLGRRNIALAVVYGPANNLLALPQSLGGGGGDLGTQRFKLPAQAAEFLGFDPEQEYTIDEVWEVAKEQPFVRSNNITKDQLAQFLGAGPATKLEDDDLARLEKLAEPYEERLKAAGLDPGRPASNYRAGGLTPWLYYQYGVLALELDVWGIPTAKDEKGEEDAADEQPLTVDRLEGMSSDEFLALDEDAIAAFLQEVGAPPHITAAMVIGRVESGQATPKQMAGMVRQMQSGGGGGKGGEDDQANKRQRDVLAWLAANHPEAMAPWTAVTLADGTQAEVGGLDPFAEVAPPHELLAPALEVHTATVLDLAGQLPRLEIASLRAQPLGAGVYRVEAVAANRGAFDSHTAMAARARSHLPVRLALETGDGVTLVTGRRAVTSERLEGRTGTLEASWLVHAAPGATIAVTLHSDNAGRDRQTVTAKGGSR